MFRRILFLSGLLLIIVFTYPVISFAQPILLEQESTNIELIQSNSEGIVIDISIPEYSIIDLSQNGMQYQQIHVPQSEIFSEPGQPQLPYISFLLGVPNLGNLSLEVVQDEARSLDGSYHLLDSPQIKVISEDLQSIQYREFKTYHRVKDRYIDEFFPLDPARISQEAWYRDQRLVSIEVFPFQYNLSSGKLIWHKTLRVKINTDSPENPSSVNQYSANTENILYENVLKANLLNYESARGWRGYSKNEINGYPLIEEQAVSLKRDSSGLVRYKITIDHNGFYKLSYDTLENAGLPVDQINPANFRMTSQGQDISIRVHNPNGDSKFDQDEYIIFYGQKFYGDNLASYYPDEDIQWRKYYYDDGSGNVWQPEFNSTMLEKYTDENVYWLTYSGPPGNRIDPGVVDGNISPAPESYPSTMHAEQSNFWRTSYLFATEDTWFWDELKYSDTVTRTYTTTITYPAEGDYSAILRGEIISGSYDSTVSPDRQIQIFLNDDELTDPVITDSWDGKGRHLFEVTIPQEKLLNGENRLDLSAKTDSSQDWLFFNWFEIIFDRKYEAINNRLWFTGEQAGTWEYSIHGFSNQSADNIVVYQITDPTAPLIYFQGVQFENGIVKFPVTHNAGAKFFVGIVEEVPLENIQPFTSPDLSTSVDYVLITHKDFLTATQRLADYRSTQGLSTLVVDVEDLYNEFNFGIYHPIAIKNFIAATFNPEYWSDPPDYVLLIGDGHFNFKGYSTYDSPPIYMPPNLSWVDPWMGEVDSSNLLATVVGPEGNPDPIPDVFIARLPVNSVSELDSTIDKIIFYEGLSLQEWHRNMLFIADNTDSAGNFIASAESIIAEYQPEWFIPERIYLEDFMSQNSETDASSVSYRPYPEVTDLIIDEINNEGALFVNYFGHAALNRWAAEQLFINEDIPLLSNNNKLPIIMSATCLDGYWNYPNQIFDSRDGSSLIEELLRANQRGAVAAFSPTGLGVSTGHDYLLEGFYNAFFNQRVDEIGPLSISAKLRLFGMNAHPDLLHTYTVFGDPALKIHQVNEKNYRMFLPIVGR